MAGDKTVLEMEQLLFQCPKLCSWWRHYKGNLYDVVAAALREEDLEPLVIYRQAGSALIFARPLREWEEEVEHEGRKVPRFAPWHGS